MSPKLKKMLLPFYFGTVSDEERLYIESELLADSEVLVDFLDLKRTIEAAKPVPSAPSRQLFAKITEKGFQKKTVWISLSMGAALAAGLALFMYLQPASKSLELATPVTNNALFDSSSELPVSSGVL